MRKRPRLHVRAPRGRAGERLEATLVVDADRRVPVAAIDAVVRGRERVIGVRGEQRELPEQRARVKVARVVPPGRHTYLLSFDLPPGLPPSYRGRHLDVEYRLAVRADIPWWPDARGEWLVEIDPVAEPPAPQRSAGTPAVESLRGRAALELVLEAPRVAPGGVVRGRVRARKQPERFELLLVAQERLAYIGFGAVEVERLAFPPLAPVSEGPTPFALAVPRHVPRTLHARLGVLTWAVHAIARGRHQDTTVRVPLEVSASPDSAPRRTPVLHAEGMMSKDMWAPRDTDGLVVDAGRLVGEYAGSRMTVWFDQRGAQRVVVGELGYPSLRLDLCVEARHQRKVAPRGFDYRKGDDDAYFIDAREAAQGRALLAGLAPALRRLPQASIDDERARFVGPVTAWMSRFVSALRTLATALAAARAELPPPAAAVALPMWRALARELGGPLAPGDLSIDGRIGAIRVEVLPDWRGPLPTLGLRVHTPFQLGKRWLGAAIDPATLPPDARAALGRVRGDDAAATLTAELERVTLRGAAIPPDPRSLTARLTALLQLAEQLRFGAGPYR